MKFLKMTLALVFCLISEVTIAQVYAPIDSSYKLTFDEEFNGTSIDASKWNTNWLGAAGTITKPVNSAELGAYDPAQCSVANGNLEMKAIQKTVRASDGRTYNYVSCLINTHRKFQQAYGYFEARMYLPGANGKIFNWPAFWANGDHSAYGRSWPFAGELDIMEGLSGYAHYHFHSDSTHAGGGPNSDFTGWHIFGALWEPGSVKFYYDGRFVGQLTTGITSLPMYVILNNAISPENRYGGPMMLPATVLVDYVHVYSRDPNAVAVTPQAGYGGPGATGSSSVPTLDTMAPTAPTAVVGQALSTSQISLTWAASADNVTVAGYRVFRNGVQVSPTSPLTSTRFVDSNLAAGSSYSYEVNAVDTSGNHSPNSLPINVMTMSAAVVTPTPTPTPSPTPVPDPTTNLVKNHSFEADVTGWKKYGSSSVQISSAYNGTKAAYLGASGSGFEQVVLNLMPSKAYVLTAYVRANSNSRMAIGVKDFGASQLASSTSSSSYTKVTIRFKTGSTAKSAKIFFYSNSGSGNADLFELKPE